MLPRSVVELVALMRDCTGLNGVLKPFSVVATEVGVARAGLLLALEVVVDFLAMSALGTGFKSGFAKSDEDDCDSRFLGFEFTLFSFCSITVTGGSKQTNSLMMQNSIRCFGDSCARVGQ